MVILSTNVRRASVSYTIPDAPNKETHVDRSWYKTIIDIMLINLNELDSLDAQAANEAKKKTDNTVPKTKQLNGITDTATKKTLEDTRASILIADSPLFAKDINSIANNLNKIYKRAKSTTTNPAATVSSKEIVATDKLQTFISTCIEISQALDPKAQPIWNADGSCKTSCETNCQTLCQLNMSDDSFMEILRYFALTGNTGKNIDAWPEFESSEEWENFKGIQTSDVGKAARQKALDDLTKLDVVAVDEETG